jgi:3-oxoacyl-[acyl-carrier protein] reductase
MDLGLKGKRALVLGASRGLGRGIARALAAEGCHLLIAARSAEPLAHSAAELRGLGVTVESQTVDLADRASVIALVDAARRGGGVDILVAISGGPPPGGALGIGDEVWHRHFDSMVYGMMTVIEAMVEGMRARQWGRVVTVASSGVVQPIANLAISNALRAGLVAWCKTLAGEVAADGVTVNVMLPGRIATERVGELDAAAARRQGIDIEKVRNASAASIPAGRYGSVEEFAAVAAFLASERASYVTGSMVRVDGGLIRSV